MPKFRVELSHQAGRVLDRMAARDPQLYQRFVRVLDDLEIDPYIGKPLKGQLKGRYSYRVGRYRLVYRIQKNILVVYVIDVGHRRDIYR